MVAKNLKCSVMYKFHIGAYSLKGWRVRGTVEVNNPSAGENLCFPKDNK